MVSYMLRLILFLFLFLLSLYLSGQSFFIFLKDGILFVCIIGFFGMIHLGFSWEDVRNCKNDMYRRPPNEIDLDLALYFWKSMIRNILLLCLISMFYTSILLCGSLDQPFEVMFSRLIPCVVSFIFAIMLSLVIVIPFIFEIKREIAAGASSFKSEPPLAYNWQYNKLIGHVCFIAILLLPFMALGGNLLILIQPVPLFLIFTGTLIIVLTTFWKKPESSLDVLFRRQITTAAIWLTSLASSLFGLLSTLGKMNMPPNIVAESIAVSLISMFWGVMFALWFSIPMEDRILRKIEDWPKVKTNEIAWFGLFFSGLFMIILNTSFLIYLNYSIWHK